MNSLLLDMGHYETVDCAILEENMNHTPIGSRDFLMPAELFQTQTNARY